jgi:pimeloyl-ACP methyl ester carboxylesterase
MPHVEGAGVALHYVERGAGSPVVVVHAMGSAAAAWEVALEALAAGGAWAIAFDRRGYGTSGAPVPYAATTVQEQVQDAGALLEALDAAPALLVGDGFGALVVLELLVRRPQIARGAVLVDPPLHAFVPEATKALAEERELLEQALREGGPQGAVRAWLGADADPELARRAAQDHVGFFADYAGQASWSPSRRELRAIGVPVAVVTGAGTPGHVSAAADAVSALVPRAQRVGDGAVVAAALALLASVA